MLIENNKTNVGIYEIRCTSTNKVYIGSSGNIKQRMRDHLCGLRKGKHGNSYLQKAWKKYGEGNFIFKCIKCLPKNTEVKKILSTEQKYLDNITPWKQEIGYNLNKIADKPPRMVGKLNPMYGKHHTEEAKAKMRGPRPSISITNTGKTMKERIGDPNWVNPLKGKKRTGWVSPCLGKKRIGWLSPCTDKVPLTFKHVSGNLKTQLKKEWVKDNIRYLYLIKSKNKNIHSFGWFYCPKCCDKLQQTCKCNEIIKKYKQQQENKQPITLKNKNGETKTLLKCDWYKCKVDINALLKGYQKISKGWTV